VGADRLQLLQRRLTISVLTFILLLLIWQLCSYFADVVRILGISVLISYLFISVVDWLEKYIKNRAMAIFIVYAFCGVAATVGLLTVVPSLLAQINGLVESIFSVMPRILDLVGTFLAPLDARLHAAQIQIRAIDLVANLAGNIPRPDSTVIFSRMGEVAMSTMTWLLYGLSILVVSFYFMLDGYRMTDWIISAFPGRFHIRMQAIANEIDLSMQAFFRGQLVMALGFGLLMLVVYILIGVPFALLLTVVLALAEIVPVIGPPIGFLPALVVVALNGLDNVPADRLWQVVILLIVFNIAQWVKDNLVAPRYIGNKIGLHPVMIFIAIMIGAKLDGMLGIIFSIPAASALNVIYQQLTAHTDTTESEATQCDQPGTATG
jgi:predicted PurR-regulated permease PerM